MEGLDGNFYKYVTENQLGKFFECEKTQQTYFGFTIKEMLGEYQKNIVFDGSKGGLIKGLDKNFSGGIYLMTVWNDTYRYLGTIQLGDYITAPHSFSTHKERFFELESRAENFLNYDLKNFSVPRDCKIINTGNLETAFILLSDFTQFVFTKSTIVSNINEIVELDN